MLDKDKILSDAKEWFTESFAKSHIANTEKLINPNEPTKGVFILKFQAWVAHSLFFVFLGLQ